MNRIPLLLPALVLCACGDAVQNGSLSLCSTVETSWEDTLLEVSGTVVALDDGTVDCSRSVTLKDAEDNLYTVGLTVLDGDGNDITEPIDLAVDQEADLLYSFIMVWGTAAGLTLHDEDGLVLAADEGTWGGALADIDLGFSVAYSEDPIATRREECMVTDGHAILFQGDALVTLDPVTTTGIQVDGQSLNATAVRANKLSSGRNCSISDTTDSLTWLVSR